MLILSLKFVISIKNHLLPKRRSNLFLEEYLTMVSIFVNIKEVTMTEIWFVYYHARLINSYFNPPKNVKLSVSCLEIIMEQNHFVLTELDRYFQQNCSNENIFYIKSKKSKRFFCILNTVQNFLFRHT